MKPKTEKGERGEIIKEESNSKMPAYPDSNDEKEKEKENQQKQEQESGKPMREPSLDKQEGGSRNYIHELTMQTMVNRDVLRKIKERKEATKSSSSVVDMTLKQLQEMVRELWDVTQNKEFSLDMNSMFPYELQKSFDQFVQHSRDFLEKHPHFMNIPQSPTSKSTKREEGGKKRGENEKEERKRDEDTKQIEVLPVFMEKQHPLWNYNYFNRKNAIHAYPVNSQYHIPTANKASRHSPHSVAPISYEMDDMLHMEDIEDYGDGNREEEWENWEDFEYLEMMEKRGK